MLADMADSLCPICLARWPDAKARTAHLRADHPGYSMRWAGRVATITSPDGTARTLTMRDFRTLRERARAGDPATADDHARLGDAGPTAPNANVAPAASGPIIDPEPAPTRITAQTRRGRVADDAPIVSRAALADAFTPEMLADMLRDLSAVISEWDGAGAAGTFSAIEARQLANLLHDQMVRTVAERFRGDIGRFKAAIAVLVIFAGKGRLHLRAIRARQAGAPVVVDAASAEPAEPTTEPEPAPGPRPAPWAAVASPQAATPVAPPTDGAFVPLTPAELARRQSEHVRAASPAVPLPQQLRESRIDGLYD